MQPNADSEFSYRGFEKKKLWKMWKDGTESKINKMLTLEFKLSTWNLTLRPSARGDSIVLKKDMCLKPQI